jgi:large subunit ribosomal protein L1
MGKKIETASEKIEKGKEYLLQEAIDKVKELSYTKFDETVDLAFNLGVDPRKSDQMVRGTVVLPHGTGKTLRVLVSPRVKRERGKRCRSRLCRRGGHGRENNKGMAGFR